MQILTMKVVVLPLHVELCKTYVAQLKTANRNTYIFREKKNIAKIFTLL